MSPAPGFRFGQTTDGRALQSFDRSHGGDKLVIRDDFDQNRSEHDQQTAQRAAELAHVQVDELADANAGS